MDAVNPLMPSASDVVWSVVAVVALGLAVWALVGLARRAPRLSSTAVLLWSLLILLVPLLGPIAWLAAGRRAGREVSRG